MRATMLAFVGDLCAQTSADEQQTEEQAELAKKLQNPVANLVSVPFQKRLKSPAVAASEEEVPTSQAP